MELLGKIEALLEYYKQLLGDEFYLDRNNVKSEEQQLYDIIKMLQSLQQLPQNATELDVFEMQIKGCKKCRLAEGRNKFVFGGGNRNADIMFIGEGPGREEDIQGKPFVGPAGQLLTKILASIHLTREEVYITNIVKCRPPNNRTPFPDEMETCYPYLEKQIKMIKPKIICLLGAAAIKGVLKEKGSISSLRGRIHKHLGIDVIVTYHPAALLRNNSYKKPTWEDVKMLRKLYDEKYLKQPFILEQKNG